MEITTKIVAGINEQDDTAFTAVFGAFNRELHLFAFRFTNSQKRAEDFVQDTFIELWNYRSFTSPDHIRAFLYAVLRNRCYNYITKQKIEEKARAVLLSRLQDQQDRGLEHDQLTLSFFEEFEKDLEKLSEKHRQVYRLHHKEGFTLKEVAEILKLRIRTIYNYNNEITTFLRNLYKHRTTSSWLITIVSISNLLSML
ncbi:RNA polymerase sigma factor [Chitinophaga arvensicola]|uniref:RNA polymerase sigma-70 factor, ECF subfamily n=1 Tax=Chitinophaga arvensicola TaxID=29529 RepID=A0A1I0PLU7_9BACT|nr:sigma-70 family RNA polymerase sigma factor [Chitinophaga arvensicola]SEW15319.1 RNA polymerase sigma-70 factor, ECF subfamily [Chitinophaga arvensicola]